MIWGNHDMVYKDPKYVKQNLSTYFDPIEDSEEELFLTHGHQAIWWNYSFWRCGRFLVRVLWKPQQVWGIADPTSPSKNYKELIKIKRRIKKWIVENKYLLTVS